VFKRLCILMMGVLLLAVPGLSEQEPLEIYFICGGTPACPFGSVIYNGAMAAAEVLGDRVDLRVVWSEWDPERKVSQFEHAVAARPHGIVIMGHPGEEPYEPFVDEAIELGIIVTTANVSLPTLEQNHRTAGFGYAGSDLYDAGYLLAEAAVERSGPVEGDRALVWGLKRQPVRGLRTQAIIDALEAAGLVVNYVEIMPEWEVDPEMSFPTFAANMTQHPDTKIIIPDHTVIALAMPTFLEDLGYGPGDVYIGTFDLSSTMVNHIRDGWIDLVHSQQPFVQGFLPVMQIYLSHHFGVTGLNIDTGVGLFDITNVDVIEDLVDQGLAG